MSLSQYFNVRIFSPKESKKQVSIDATPYIEDGLSILDEDGLIKECTFDMKNSYLMMDILSIGMRVEITGGTLIRSELLFTGYIKSLEPDFRDDGDVTLRVSVHSSEGGKLGVVVKDIIYPSSTNKDGWATKDLMYSDIIINLAKNSGITVNDENIRVVKDIKASSKGAVRQRNKTDWAFMQELAEKIGCTMWTEERNGQTYLYLKDDRFIVSSLANYTFFYLARLNDKEFINIAPNADRQIQLLSAKVKLDTSSGAGSYKQKQTTDPKTGQPKTQVYTDKPIKNEKGEETGESERWVLDEDKLRAMSFDDRNQMIELFMSGKVTWEGEGGGVAAKNYFRKELITGSSREGTPNHTEVESADSYTGVKKDGINPEGAVKDNTGSSSVRVVIDEDKLRNLPSEERTAIMGRIVRKQMTEDDKKYYQTVDTTPKDGKDDADKATAGKQNTQAGVDKTRKKPKGKTSEPRVETNREKRKRDDGFTITAKIYGNLDIKPRKSYIIEGLGKYSGKYYLYKVTRIFGRDGFMMDLIFTK